MSRRQRYNFNCFEVIPVVEAILPERQKSQVTCTFCTRKQVFVGTIDGLVLHYQLEENKTPMKKVVFLHKLEGERQLSLKKPVQHLILLPSKRIIAIMEGVLYLMHQHRLQLIDTNFKAKGISCICVNESKYDPDATSEIVVGFQKKKQIHVYSLNEDRFSLVKEHSIPDPAVQIARDGSSLCVALSLQPGEGRYVILDLVYGKTIDLCDYRTTKPLVKRTGKGEFLLSTGILGVVGFASGSSNRPPIEWSADPTAVAYHFPFVLSLSEEENAIHIYSLLDQKVYQKIPFQLGRTIFDSNNSVFAAGMKSVYLISPLPKEKIIDQMIEGGLIEEALLLAETFTTIESRRNPDEAETFMLFVKKKAGFVYFSKGNWSTAESLFIEGELDPREIICLFPDLIPINSEFVPMAEEMGIHTLPPIQELVKIKELSLIEAKNFLVMYLQNVRTIPLSAGKKKEIDTALLKLLAEKRSQAVVDMVSTGDPQFSVQECAAVLEQYKCYYELGLFHSFQRNPDLALKIWTRICDGELEDKNFEGMSFIINYLSKLSIPKLVYKYGKWALQKDEKVGVKMFALRPSEDAESELSFDAILEFLRPFETASLIYLEELTDRGLENEDYHTRLAVLYLNDALRQAQTYPNSKEAETARTKLRTFLQFTSHYNAPALLGKLKETDFFQECAIIYGQMGYFEKAIALMVEKEKDLEEVEKFCSNLAKNKSREVRCSIFHTFICAVIQLEESTKKSRFQFLVGVLTKHAPDINMAKTLEILPPSWPLEVIAPALVGNLRETLSTSRHTQIKKGLVKSHNLRVKESYISERNEIVRMGEYSTCPVCNLPFGDTPFMRYPNGTVIHLKCSRNRSICPVTGVWFGGDSVLPPYN